LVFGGLVALALVLSGRASSAGGQKQPRVVDIRFGVVEPPVVAQHDITVRAATSNQELEAKPLECSGLAWSDGHLIITSDRHRHMLFTCSVDVNNMTIGQPEAHVVIDNEQSLLDDAECITMGRRGGAAASVYVMCSLSNGPSGLPLPMRRHMLRLNIRRLDRLGTKRPTILSGGAVRGAVNFYFKDANVKPYRTYSATFREADKNTYRWANVEGIAFAPEGSVLLCGMRNPLYGGRAIVFAIESFEEAFARRDAGRMKLVDLFSLDLGERGISDLCWDPLTKGYLITAAKSNGPKLDNDEPFPPNTLDSAVFWWSGRKKDKPMLFARMPDMKVEAVCRLGETDFVALGCDEGDVSEGRAARQSIVTIIHFRGLRW